MHALRLILSVISVASLALVASGCGCDEHETATCGAPPADVITDFAITIRTGSDETDADIFFCARIRGEASSCTILDSPADDFERGATQTFFVPFGRPGTDLTGFFIENRGNAIFFDNEWEIAGVTLVARTPTEQVVLYDEPSITCDDNLDSGDLWAPLACGW